MRAVICHQKCSPEDLRVEEIDPPMMVQGGVRIAIKAAGINFADTLIIRGSYQRMPDFPFSPGLEAAGEVLECSADVTHVKPGDRVLATLDHGGFAEQAVARSSDVHKISESLDFETAAGFPVAYGTSHVGIVHKLALTSKDTILIHGAAGGVGLTAVEVARKVGARIIATAGGADKLAIAKAAGADELIDYKKEDVRERVKQLTDNQGVSAVYDPVGGEMFETSLRCVTPDARMLVVGFAAGKVQQIPANILLVKNTTVIGFDWGAYRRLDPDMITDSFRELLQWYDSGDLKPHISHTFTLDDITQALATLISRKSTGKIVLKL